MCCALIEKDHLGDWSREGLLLVTDVSTTFAEAIFRVAHTPTLQSQVWECCVVGEK